MIIEQEIKFEHDSDNILKEIYQKGSIEEKYPNSIIIIKYYGNKSQIPLRVSQKNDDEDKENILNQDDPRNDFLFIQYKDLYYGALLLKDLYKRENFGLNLYSENSFYIGRWKENMKDGIGFLKIDENLMYVGNFENNQFNGFGVLLNKTNKDLLFGEFNNGECEEGIFYNMETEYFYRGKIKNGQKNDELCTFFDTKNGYLFIGEIIDDEFNKGYLGFCQIDDNNNNNNDGNESDFITFNVQKIFYFDGLGADNKTFIHYYAFTPEFFEKIQDIMFSVFQADYNLKDQNKNWIEYFAELENIKNNPNYYNLENYNSFNNEQCIENEFISNYYNHYQDFRTGQKDIYIREHENFLMQPQILSDMKEEKDKEI